MDQKIVKKKCSYEEEEEHEEEDKYEFLFPNEWVQQAHSSNSWWNDGTIPT